MEPEMTVDVFGVGNLVVPVYHGEMLAETAMGMIARVAARDDVQQVVAEAYRGCFLALSSPELFVAPGMGQRNPTTRFPEYHYTFQAHVVLGRFKLVVPQQFGLVVVPRPYKTTQVGTTATGLAHEAELRSYGRHAFPIGELGVVLTAYAVPQASEPLPAA